MSKNYEKELLRIFFEGRSIAIKLEGENTPPVLVAEGIVHEGEIVWCPPSLVGVIVASSPKILAGKGLKPGQKVSLLLKSILDDDPKIVPETYDDFLEKINNRDESAVSMVRYLAVDAEVDKIFAKCRNDG